MLSRRKEARNKKTGWVGRMVIAISIEALWKATKTIGGTLQAFYINVYYHSCNKPESMQARIRRKRRNEQQQKEMAELMLMMSRCAPEDTENTEDTSW